MQQPFTIGQEMLIPNDPNRIFASDQCFIVRNITPVDDAWECELGGLDGGPMTVAARFNGNGKLLAWTPDQVSSQDDC